MKIIGNEYHSHDSYILKIETLKNDEILKSEIFVEYSHQEICVSEGYEIYYPVDSAHQEPSEYKHYIEIIKVNKIENEDITDEIILDSKEQELIEEYLIDLKKSE